MRATSNFALALAGLCEISLASPWIATNYEIVATETIYPASTYTDGYVASAYLQTETLDAVPTVTPLPEGLPARTTQDLYYSDVTNVYVVLPGSAGKTAYYYTSRDDSYYVLLTYTASSTCATPWTYTTSAPLYLPAGVKPTVTASSAVPTSLGTYIAPTTIYNQYVAEKDIPAATLSSLASEYEPMFSESCTIPYYYTETGSATYAPYPSSTLRSGGDDPGDFSSGDYSDCEQFTWYFGTSSIGGGYLCPDGYHYTHGLTLTAFVCIWIFSILGFFFFAGLVQNYYSFRSLCLGKSARRGLPWLWALMLPVLSCLLLIAARSGYAAKDPGEQAVLRERWDGIGAGTKFRQWLKWGFRFKYPPFLGLEPPKRGHHRGNQQGVYQYLPPGAPGYAPYGQQGYQTYNPQMQQWQQPQFGSQGMQQQQQQYPHGLAREASGTNAAPGPQSEGLAPVPAHQSSQSGSGVSPVSPATATWTGGRSDVSQSEHGAGIVAGPGGNAVGREAQSKNPAAVQELDAGRR